MKSNKKLNLKQLNKAAGGTSTSCDNPVVVKGATYTGSKLMTNGPLTFSGGCSDTQISASTDSDGNTTYTIKQPLDSGSAGLTSEGLNGYKKSFS